MKRISCFLLAVLMLTIVPVSAFAGEMDTGSTMENEEDSSQEDTILSPVETGELGSITIKLEDSSKNVPKGGVSLAVVRVADVENGEFILTEEFESTKVDLNQIQTADELEEAAKKLQAEEPEKKTTITTDTSGVASISELPVGVYLIYAMDIAQYDQITSTLVSIPTFDEAAGALNYDIELFPKHVPVPEKTPTAPVKTGVEDHVMAYVGVLVLSSAVAVFLLIKATKKKQQTK